MRMGIGFAVVSLGFLTGPPIAGALLSSSNDWSKAIIFNGVSYRYYPPQFVKILNYNIGRVLFLLLFRLRFFRATGLRSEERLLMSEPTIYHTGGNINIRIDTEASTEVNAIFGRLQAKCGLST